jgi:hypothetical protein
MRDVGERTAEGGDAVRPPGLCPGSHRWHDRMWWRSARIALQRSKLAPARAGSPVGPRADMARADRSLA